MEYGINHMLINFSELGVLFSSHQEEKSTDNDPIANIPEILLEQRKEINKERKREKKTIRKQ